MHTPTFLFLRICQYEGRDILHTIKRNQIDWIGHIRCGNCPLNHLMEGKVEEQDRGMRRRRKRRKQLLINFKEKQAMKFERGSTRSHSMQYLLWKRLWTCRKADYALLLLYCGIITIIVFFKNDKLINE